MKKIFCRALLLVLLLSSCSFAADVSVFSEDGKFGLKDSKDNVIAKPVYKKLIALGETSYIALKGSKYGLVAKDGSTILDFKYTHAARVLGKFVKFGNYKGYGLYDEEGRVIIPQEQDSIDILFGGMFLVSKNYKYGLVDFNGNIILDYVCDDIYMPKPNIMRVKYNGEWYEIEQVSAQSLSLPKDIQELKTSSEFKITKLVTSPGAASKYSVVTTTDYFLKILSSISPAYEATIDELMLSQGAEAVSIFMKVSWLPKFPFVYAKNYYKTFRNPNNGPLSGLKENIMRELQTKETPDNPETEKKITDN